MKDDIRDLLEKLGVDPDTPIGLYLDELAESYGIPVVALTVCIIRIDEAGPKLREMLVRAALGQDLDDRDATLLFRGLHILGGARDTAAFKPLLIFLRRPVHELDALLADAITESLARIVAGVFDGDADALLGAIAHRETDEFVRDALIGAAAFLAWDGKIDRDLFQQFLERFFEERLAVDEDHSWYAWQEAIALLGMNALRPIVHQAFEQGRLSPRMLSLKDFEDDLAAAENAPDDSHRFEKCNLGYIEDVLEALQWTDIVGPDPFEAPHEDAGMEEYALPALPVTNSLRSVGRNDPCPCGSGAKFKKCCLGK